MASLDQSGSRVQSRPYYNAEKFNIGYPAVFNPDRGVLDQNGASMASKLSIANQKNSPFKNTGSNSNLLGRIIPLGSSGTVMVGQYSSQVVFPGMTLNWNDIFNINKWENIIWKVLLRQYCKNLIQQPFDTCKIIMQTSSITSGVVPAEETTVIQRYDDDDDDNDNDHEQGAEEEIDFFPLYTPDVSLDSDQNPVENSNNLAHDGMTLQINKLDTLSVISAIRDNENFGITSLWRSNNVTFLYNFLRKGIKLFTSHVITPFYYYYNLNLSTILVSRIVTTFLTEVILLPLDLYKVKLIISRDDSTNDSLDKDDINEIEVQKPNFRLFKYWNFKLDNKILRLFALIILKIACKKFFDNGLEFLIYYYLNFANVNNRIYFIFLLKFVTEFCEFFIKLPIETLIRRYQVDYLLTNDNDTQMKITRSNLVINPINVNTSQRFQGLWNGWKIGLMSLVCGFGFKLMNKIDDDLEQERF